MTKQYFTTPIIVEYEYQFLFLKKRAMTIVDSDPVEYAFLYKPGDLKRKVSAQTHRKVIRVINYVKSTK